MNTQLDAQIDYAEKRIAHRNVGEKILFGMMYLGNAFRFIEKLYNEGAIDFQTRRIAGNTICELYESLRQEAYIYNFSHSIKGNEGCL